MKIFLISMIIIWACLYAIHLYLPLHYAKKMFDDKYDEIKRLHKLYNSNKINESRPPNIE